jgi:hypothetical protein
MIEITKKLNKYKKSECPKLRKELESFILEEELKLTTMFSCNSKISPCSSDEHQEIRNLLRKIRIELKLV